MRSAGPAWTLSLGLSCAGLVGVLVSGGLLFDAEYARWTWVRSEEHQRIEREVEAALPREVEPPDDGLPVPLAGGEGRASELPPRFGPPTRVAGRPPAPVSPTPRSEIVTIRQPPTGATPFVGSPIAASASVAPDLVAAELRFLDPPEPGAHAVLSLTVKNRSSSVSPSIVVSVPAEWFDRFAIIGAIPAVLDDQVLDDGYRHFEFPGAAPNAGATLELHAVAADDGIDPPIVRLALRDGISLGELRPEMTGARPRPGPVRVLSIPRLRIRTGVVKTGWEPPAFVAGQIAATAALAEGNAVLVGHRRGHAGDVFERLLGAKLGDEVVAASRAGEQRYVVSEIRILPGDDITPIGPTKSPRLTLMTCTGTWNPLTNEYSHRLWVIAEPPDLARATLAAAIVRATEAELTSTSQVEALRARADATVARSALVLMDARSRSRP
jgi:LPXTG-site transpeptidase (sortase) family protein